MSLVTVSAKKGGRIYHRHFDHDEARRLRAAGWSYRKLAEHFGVSATAVTRVCDPAFRAAMEARTKAYNRRNRRKPCKGDCGRLVWHMSPPRTGYCRHCRYEQQVSADVRPHELRCTRCREWKPDADFPTDHPGKQRRGRSPRCRACSTAVRREYRHGHPKQAEAENRRARESRRKEKPVSKYIVFQPNGDQAFVEVARVDAASPAHAIEQAATAAGDYVAVPEGRFKLMRVAPVEAFRVIPDGEPTPELIAGIEQDVDEVLADL